MTALSSFSCARLTQNLPQIQHDRSFSINNCAVSHHNISQVRPFLKITRISSLHHRNVGAYDSAGPEAMAAAKYFAFIVGKKADQAQPKMKEFLETAVTHFDFIRPSMNKQLANELAQFFTLLSTMWKDDDLHLGDARNNDVYRDARSGKLYGNIYTFRRAS